MAKQVITTTEYIDDLDGSAAAGTVTFGFEGRNYEIDLSKANARALEKTMALYVGHARKVRAPRAKSASRRASDTHDLAAVREWAARNGFEVAERGRIARDVLDAYDAAN